MSTYLCVSKGGERKFIQDVRQYELFLSLSYFSSCSMAE
jgi:hypothetical protein